MTTELIDKLEHRVEWCEAEILESAEALKELPKVLQSLAELRSEVEQLDAKVATILQLLQRPTTARRS